MPFSYEYIRSVLSECSPDKAMLITVTHIRNSITNIEMLLEIQELGYEEEMSTEDSVENHLESIKNILNAATDYLNTSNSTQSKEVE